MLATIWSPAVVAAIAGVIVNIVIRYVTAPRLSPLLRPFRQIGPIIRTAAALQAILPAEAAALEPMLSDDVVRLRRLRRVARWVAHDPVTSDDLTSAVYESLNMLLLLDVSVLCVASREIVSNGGALLRMVAVVGTVDAAVAVASYREGTADWTCRCAASVTRSCRTRFRILSSSHPRMGSS